MKSIAVFNNKGGVGKTTLLVNLASYMAHAHAKRVLVIDADPQCNATQSMFSDSVVEGIYGSDRFTIYSVVHPLSIGKGYARKLYPRKSPNFALEVIPGDPRLALTEDLLATDWVQAVGGNVRGLRTTFLFAELLERCDDYDLVFFDMGPSLGSINRAVLLAVDFFISPMSIDIFSLRAIENIAVSLEKWRKQLELGLNLAASLEELEIEDPRWKLQFAGYVTQQYTAKRDARGERRPVSAFDNIMQQLPAEIDRHLVLGEGNSDGDDSVDYNIGTIPTLHSLIPLSQTSRKPIFGLKARDGVVGAHFTRVKEYEQIISYIADRVLENVDALA